MIEFGDNGGIILMVNDESTTNSVKYSLDGGITFREFAIDKDLNGGTFRIQNIIAEPSGSTNHFVLFGRIRSRIEDVSVSIHLNFENVWPRTCIEDTDQEKSDFELWPPFSELKCQFGAKVYYI